MNTSNVQLSPRLDYVVCASPAGLHKMAYWEWGDPANPRVLMCVHGLTRTGRDFDELARALSPYYRVICPDVVGRGASDHLANPNHYIVPQYVADMVTLLARLQPQQLDWIGTSMGGLIGLTLIGMLSAADWPIAFRRLILNDVGPVIDVPALERIGNYVGDDLRFDTFAQAVDAAKQRWAAFGEHSQAQWEHLAKHVFKQTDAGWELVYDLGIATPFLSQLAKMQTEAGQKALAASQAYLWQAYQAAPDHVMVIRGEQSDLLSVATAQQMVQQHPQALLHVVDHVGHAPTLMQPEQIQPIKQFLLKD